jgi:hypothetical protein
MPHRISPDASMSADELRALRYLWRGLPKLVGETHTGLLVRMGLAKVNVEGTLEITQAGTHRFTVERHRSASALAGASPTAGGHITWRLDDQSRSW